MVDIHPNLHTNEQQTYEIAERLRVLQLEQHEQQHEVQQQVQQHEQQHEQQRHEEAARTEAQPTDAARRRNDLFADCARREETSSQMVDDTSSISSLEEWEATEGGGFAQMGPGVTHACPGEWYVDGFERDMCSGTWRERVALATGT